MTAAVLVMAKAPVAGSAKTRLGVEVGMDVAADLAAAALLDTLAACDEAFVDRHLALDGDLGRAHRGAEIAAALAGWVVFDQCGTSFAERLAHAHARVSDAGADGVVQVGMDTPQITASVLRTVIDHLDAGAETVIGPAVDGGWWILGLDDGARAAALVDVPMSTPDTCGATVRALVSGGASLALVEVARDVDTFADAVAVAAAAPTTRFAHAWNARIVAAS